MHDGHVKVCVYNFYTVSKRSFPSYSHFHHHIFFLNINSRILLQPYILWGFWRRIINKSIANNNNNNNNKSINTTDFSSESKYYFFVVVVVVAKFISEFLKNPVFILTDFVLGLNNRTIIIRKNKKCDIQHLNA